MKLIRNFLFWFVVFLISVNIILAGFTYSTKEVNLATVTSPLPNILIDNFFRDSVFWQPDFSAKASSGETLEITSLSAISYDTTTDTLLYDKNSNARLPMASITKIMTAIIALENLDMSKKVKVTKSAAEIGEGTMGLSEGEILTVEELLYGLLLHSGNDAAETIAQTSKFGRSRFLHLMNKKAEDLGLSNTRFSNPSGLEGDGEQYSTARELIVLTKYAMKNPTFAKIVGTYEHIIPSTSEHKEFHLFNETNLLTTYPGVKGVKTGFTHEAGMCLVTYLDYGGHQIIAVLLNSQNRRDEMATLLDYSLTKLGIEPPRRLN